jgi:Ca2+-binding RTX toxin-like protein
MLHSKKSRSRKNRDASRVFEPLEGRALMSTVAMFYDPAYVNTTASPANSATAANLKAQLIAQGHVVKTFAGISSSAWSTALTGADAVVVPANDNMVNDLNTALSNATKDVIRGFVNKGGGYLSVGNTWWRNTKLMSSIFNYSISGGVGYAGGNETLSTVDAAGTKFAGGPSSLAMNDTTYGSDTRLLSAGMRAVYRGSIWSASSVLIGPKGTGDEVVSLGWNFKNGGPNGAQDGNWNEVLKRAVAQVTQSPAKGPEVAVFGGNVEISDGDTTPGTADLTDFGATKVGAQITRTFTVKNTGSAPLTTNNLTLPAGFSIDSGDPLAASIAAGKSDTFKVKLDATAAGLFAGNISFSNNDSNENPYNFAIKGVVNSPTFNFANNVITVSGTSGNDFIRGSVSNGVLTLKMNSLTAKYAGAGSISKIVVNALAGNDTVIFAPSVSTASSLNGGDGDDVISGGNGADAINGGNGVDTAFKGSTDTVSLVEDILT